MGTHIGLLILIVSGFGLVDRAMATTPVIPEEYETTGGHSLAFGGSVATAIGGMSAIRSNPALLALEKEYSLNGNYHWPSAGRDFYQLGVIDGKTSSLAAGVMYTGAMDHYQGVVSQGHDESSLTLSKDSPMVRRASAAMAAPLGRMYVGFGLGYTEARPPGETFVDARVKNTKGVTVGFGLAAHITPEIRLGFSAENLANKKLNYVSPTFYRLGASYFLADIVSFHLDLRRREDVAIYEGQTPAFALEQDDQTSGSGSDETLVSVSSSVKVYDLLRVVVSTGQTRSKGDVKTRMGGGVSLINKNFNFSYQTLKYDVSSNATQQALALGLDVAI